MSDSSSDDDDPFALPGTIKTSTAVAIEDVSSDDDCGTNAWLKSGQAKKDALKEKERLQNLRTQAEGTKPSDAVDGDPDVVVVEDPASVDGPSPKRPRRGGKQPAPSVGRGAAGGGAAAGSSSKLDASPPLAAEDRELLERLEAQRANQAREREKRLNAFNLDDDDNSPAPVPTAPRQQGGGHARARSQGGAAAASRKVWLKVYTDGSEPKLISCVADEPLSASDLRERIANAFSFEAARLRLRRAVVEEDVDDGSHGVQAAEELPMGHTPVQLGLTASPASALLWAEEAALEILTLKLRLEGKDAMIPMSIAPDGTFGDLLQRFCAQHGMGLTPQQCRMVFDGDVFNDSETPQDHELENDDLIEVQRR